MDLTFVVNAGKKGTRYFVREKWEGGMCPLPGQLGTF